MIKAVPIDPEKIDVKPVPLNRRERRADERAMRLEAKAKKRLIRLKAGLL
jgi:hypothetical protein